MSAETRCTRMAAAPQNSVGLYGKKVKPSPIWGGFHEPTVAPRSNLEPTRL